MDVKPEEISKVIKTKILDYDAKVDIANFGTVIEVGDGIARVYGL